MSQPVSWRPGWARATAWTVMAAAGAAALFPAWVIVDDLIDGHDKFHGLAAGLAGAGLGVLAVAAAPLAWFVLRGGRVAFAVGTAFFLALLGAWTAAGF